MRRHSFAIPCTGPICFAIRRERRAVTATETRKECEQRAITHASECAGEAWPESRMWVSSKWRLLIWSPENLAGQPCSTIQFKSPLAKKKIRKTKTRGLSKPQITVLLLCIDDKLSRYGTGWAFDDGFGDPDPGRMYATATINCLWERGLLDANFTDPRLLCSELGEVRKRNNTQGEL
jgi:hypothetical protein